MIINKNLLKITYGVCISLLFFTSPSFSEDHWLTADEIIESIKLPNIPTKTYSIVDYGAKNSATFDSHPSIITTINTASENGGGWVIIPAGTWYSKGPIQLKSNINFHLSEGATLLFSPNPADYLPGVKTKWEGTELISYSPLIYAANVHDVAITGKGRIDGNIKSQFIPWIDKATPDYKKLRHMGATGTPLEKRVFTTGTHLRPPLIQFFHADRVLLEDYTSVNSPFWVNHIVYANDVTVRNIRVNSHIGNNDGIDIESSSRVLIENSWFRTGDDSVVIKSGRDLDGRTIGIPSTNIVVRNNDMGGEDGIGLGSEMSGGIQNVHFINNILRKGDSAFRFKANLDRGGIVEHIRILDTRVEQFKNIFWFQLNYPREGLEKFISVYKDIIFENITVEQASMVFEVHAPQESPLFDVTFKNVNVKAADTIFNIENAKNINFENFQIGNQSINGTLSWTHAKSNNIEH